MMESVVLDNVVFEDIAQSDNSGEQTGEKESSPKPIINNNNDLSENTYSSSPTSSSSPSSSYHNTNVTNNTNNTVYNPPSNASYSYPTDSFSNQYDAGAFAPEYNNNYNNNNRESTYKSDSAFRETTFSAEIPKQQVESIPIDIAVTEPEKLGDGMNSYITYKIKTNASYPKLKESSVVVRRYNDFLWFHEQLRSNNKGVLIPPLPEKALINRFSAEFIEIRRKELEKFLNRVAQHPILHRRPEMVIFLESSDEQFSAIKSKTVKPQPATEQPPPQQSSGGGFGSFVSFLGQGIAAATNFTASNTAREIDHWFDAKKNYVNALEAHLSSLLKATSKLLARRKELAAAHSDFASAISIVGSTEAETDSFLSTAFIRIGQITEHIKDLGEQLFRNETTHFEEALKDYLRVLGAVKDMLADRDEVLLDYQNATRLYDTKREKLEKDKAKSSSKAKGAERELDEAQKKVEDTKREYESISTTVRSELEVFDATRAREIRRMIALLVQSNMENSLQMVDLWKSYISDTQGSDEKDWKTSDKVGWGGIGNLR